MSRAPIRRSQLIAPFGVGSLLTGPDGVSMITASLDGWFDDVAERQIDLDEYRIREWRLEQALRVKEFRLPPDYRTNFGHWGSSKNLNLTIPFLRFPVWNACPACGSLQRIPPHQRGLSRCESCTRRNQAAGKNTKARFVAQVRFVAMCSKGHLQDFPWREWVHRSVSPSCDKPMRLVSTGGASLASEVVKCDCNQQRNLGGILEATRNADGTVSTALTSHLSPDAPYPCRGLRPWIDDRIGEPCGEPLYATLRSATNLYFPHTESAIYLPGGAANLPERLVEALEQPPLSNHVAFLVDMGMLTVDAVRKHPNAHLIEAFTDEVVKQALDALYKDRLEAVQGGPTNVVADGGDEQDEEEDLAPSIRRPEFEVLRNSLESNDLTIKRVEPKLYGAPISTYFERVNLVEKLRETRVLCGFTRVEPNRAVGSIDARKAKLWQHQPGYERSWLPAYVVRGEGLFLEFNEAQLSAWERRPEVIARVRRLAAIPERVRVSRVLADAAVVPRFVVLHTFAHILINQLVFDCGYSSASLRERIFCAGGAHPMGAVLIYTAAGDSEGTMGGLVRMGRPGELESAVAGALDRALWCSADPVCMELGEHGQGPGGLNNAACHGCALLPETACEFFNKYLDRALVTGTVADPSLGLLGRT